ncbi:polyprenyl synthetase family protein, partial [Lactiplantibacillus plantarum]|nr:polyprenyl synthetase family protein [Lactiplantibacillus plantarum]
QRLVINAGGVVQAQELATKYTQDALAIMRKLPDQPAKTDLISLTKRLLDRHN